MRFIPDSVGEDHPAFKYEIYRTTVGSEVHGTGLPGHEDHDEMGIFVETKSHVIGFDKLDHFTWRSKPEGVRSEAGDIDLVLYSLRKFLHLAMQGNPSIIQTLFIPREFVIYKNWAGHELTELTTKYIVSKKAGLRYLGYLDSQMKRFEESVKGNYVGHMPKRPELVERFGYDTKYAMHALRLGYQGIELMETGHITLPIPQDPGDFLRAVRRGEYSFRDVFEDLTAVRARLSKAIEDSSLPEEPDYGMLENWLIQVHECTWSSLLV